MTSKQRPTFIVVKYDVFPYCLIHELDGMEHGYYRVKDVGLYKHDAVLATLDEKSAKKLKSTLAKLEHDEREFMKANREKAKAAIEKAKEEVRWPD